MWDKLTGQISAWDAELVKERHGLFGAVTARAPAQVLRLSLIYALLDGSNEIRSEHLDASHEVWRYCVDSARYIFGDAIGDPTADEILSHIRRSTEGYYKCVSKSAIFSAGIRPAMKSLEALTVLHNGGLARFEKEPTKGRSSERWFAVGGGFCRPA